MSNPMSNSASNPRRSKGRQKIEMKKMTNESNLQVTFSKRRNGLFKKASELCTLCGVEVALIVFSPAQKAFSFGHPSVDAVIDRFMMKPQPPSSATMLLIEAQRRANERELSAHLSQINADLEIEQMCNDELNRQRKAAQEQFWWAAPIEELNDVVQLGSFKFALEDLMKNVTEQAQKQVVTQGPTANPPSQFFAGGSSYNNPPLLIHQPPHFFPVQPPQLFLEGGSSSRNPSVLFHQPPCPPPPQLIPVPPQQQFFAGGSSSNNPSVMHPMMMPHPGGFNNMGGGFGPPGGFF